MTATVKAADLARGTAVMWLGERQVIEAVKADEQNPEIVDLHFFGIARWFATPAVRQIEVTS